MLAYQGALAYVYVADRSSCRREGSICDWGRPPRYEEDLLPLASAIWLNNKAGHLVPELQGTLDMVLIRKPRAQRKDELPFEVYTGGHRTVPVAKYLSEHPHPDYLNVEARLRDLTVGRYGDRVGDILLIAKSGVSEPVENRFYFGSTYYSWHGSPSRGDSEIPLIVAHREYAGEAIRAKVERILDGNTAQQNFTDILLGLRFSEKNH